MARRAGYDIIPYRPSDNRINMGDLLDLTPLEKEIVRAVMPYTLTGQVRVAALLNAIRYIVGRQIPGDIAECGVWRGGSMMAVAMTLVSLGDLSRHLYLYDTFEGMSEPTESDKIYSGESAKILLERDPAGIGCAASLEGVRSNLFSTGYPEGNIHFIKGKVEQTIPATMPGKLALLRLDTDWYESTKHELNHLFPLLDPAGILIIDDYGYWQGARKATDEYFKEQNLKIYLHRVDYTCRVAIRTTQ